MFFHEILDDVLAGKRATRKDWNGKGMFIYYVPPKTYTAAKYYDRGTLTDHERLTNTVKECGHMILYNDKGERVIGWLVSQTDLTSDQWELLR